MGIKKVLPNAAPRQASFNCHPNRARFESRAFEVVAGPFTDYAGTNAPCPKRAGYGSRLASFSQPEHALLMNRIKFLPCCLVVCLCSVTACLSQQLLFEDQFRAKLGEGWSWLREHRQAWRVTSGALEVLVEPGNMWGPQNDAKNVLLRPAPALTNKQIELAVTVENRPAHQYEQADLVWYFDDSNMVKLGQELVDGKLSVVMGREEADKTQTIAIIPLATNLVRLMLIVNGKRISGKFRPGDAGDWQTAGECEIPSVGKPPKISLQFYQGAPGVEHWVRVTDFTLRQRKGVN